MKYLFIPLFIFSLSIKSETLIAISTNEHKHIFKLELKYLNNNIISISNYVCFKCLNKKKLDFRNSFVKTICGKVKYDGKVFSVYCSSDTIGYNTMFSKQFKGTLTEAFMSGETRHETLPRLSFGQAEFHFINAVDYKNYIKIIENSKFYTTKEYKLAKKVREKNDLINEIKKKLDTLNKKDIEKTSTTDKRDLIDIEYKNKIRNLEEIEKMHSENLISDEEKDKMRNKILDID